MSAQSRAPNQFDAHIGTRLRVRRVALEMSQEQLGKKLGVTFQQIQKYERGTNRVSGSRFVALCKALDVPVSYFFTGIMDVNPDAPTADDALIFDFIQSADGIDIATSFAKIKDETKRRRLRDLMRALADE